MILADKLPLTSNSVELRAVSPWSPEILEQCVYLPTCKGFFFVQSEQVQWDSPLGGTANGLGMSKVKADT